MGRKHYIDKAIVKPLSKPSNLMGAYLVAHVWAVIVAMIALFILWPNPLSFIIAICVIAGRQLGMAILMHEAAHGVLFKSKKLNNFFGQYALAYPVGADMLSYRTYHLQHHRHAQRPEDPDIGLSAPFPITRQSFWRKIARDLSGLTALKLRLGQVFLLIKNKKSNEAADRVFDVKNMARPYLINLALFGVFWLSGYWWAYFALWLLPLMTVFQLVLRIRNIAEHAMTSNDDNPLTHARTTYANLFERIMVAPYWVNYHVEHHAFMYVPCWRLKALHNEMGKAGHHKVMEIQPSYRAVLRTAITP